MPITGLNHAVLYVRNVADSVRFYTEVLGFRPVERLSGFAGAAFLQAPGSSNDHDLGLFEVGADAAASGAGHGRVGLYHLAWEVDTLSSLESVLDALHSHGALVGATDHGTTKSLYGRDPDGIEFEVAWVVPGDHLDDEALRPGVTAGRLDLAREKARYGPALPGGVGISRRAAGEAPAG